MITGIGLGATNPIQMMNATNAFKAAQATVKEQLKPDTSEGLDIADSNNILKTQNLDEIREFAKIAGENDLSNDDIKYGLTYGRSVIADYLI